MTDEGADLGRILEDLGLPRFAAAVREPVECTCARSGVVAVGPLRDVVVNGVNVGDLEPGDVLTIRVEHGAGVSGILEGLRVPDEVLRRIQLVPPATVDQLPPRRAP